MNEAEQKAAHAEKYPLCTRWDANFKEAMTIINFLGWLTNGDPSGHVEEGHDCCIAAYGRYTETGEFGISYHGGERLIPVSISNENLAYAYLGIDKQAIELERRAMLAEFTGARE